MPKFEDEYWSYGFTKNPPVRPIGVVDGIAGKPTVRFVARYTGAFHVFTAVTHDTFEELQVAVDDFWEAGLRTDWYTLEKPSQVDVPKRHSPDYNAILLLRATSDAEEVLDRIDEAFASRAANDPEHEHFSYGAAIVNGEKYELLVDLGADVYEELLRTVREDLLTIPGVGAKAPGYAYLPGNAWRPPHQQD